MSNRISQIYEKSLSIKENKITITYGIPILIHDATTGVIKINNNEKNPTKLNYSGMTAMKLINYHIKKYSLPIKILYNVGYSKPGYSIVLLDGYTLTEEHTWFVLTPKEPNARSFINKTNT